MSMPSTNSPSRQAAAGGQVNSSHTAFLTREVSLFVKQVIRCTTNSLVRQAIDFGYSSFQPEALSMFLPGIDMDGTATDFFNWEQ